MKITVLPTGIPAPAPKEPELFLKLIEHYGTARVVACHPNGDPIISGNLLVFNNDGTVTMCRGVSSAVPFQKDGEGRMVVRADA